MKKNQQNNLMRRNQQNNLMRKNQQRLRMKKNQQKIHMNKNHMRRNQQRLHMKRNQKKPPMKKNQQKIHMKKNQKKNHMKRNQQRIHMKKSQKKSHMKKSQKKSQKKVMKRNLIVMHQSMTNLKKMSLQKNINRNISRCSQDIDEWAVVQVKLIIRLVMGMIFISLVVPESDQSWLQYSWPKEFPPRLGHYLKKYTESKSSIYYR